MELVEPSAKYKDSYIEAVREFQSSGEPNDREKQYQKISPSELETDFDSYVEKEKSKARGLNLPPGYVAATTYWLIDGDEFIGRVSIRHELTETLRKLGGHIGYDIRPSKRRRGYGSKILELALIKARELGIKDALLTCDATNEGSRKIIEKNGGVFESKESNPETGVDKLRYWIRIGGESSK